MASAKRSRPSPTGSTITVQRPSAASGGGGPARSPALPRPSPLVGPHRQPRRSRRRRPRHRARRPVAATPASSISAHVPRCRRRSSRARATTGHAGSLPRRGRVTGWASRVPAPSAHWPEQLGPVGSPSDRPRDGRSARSPRRGAADATAQCARSVRQRPGGRPSTTRSPLPTITRGRHGRIPAAIAGATVLSAARPTAARCTWPASWTATVAGRGAGACPARRATPRARRTWPASCASP